MLWLFLIGWHRYGGITSLRYLPFCILTANLSEANRSEFRIFSVRISGRIWRENLSIWTEISRRFEKDNPWCSHLLEDHLPLAERVCFCHCFFQVFQSLFCRKRLSFHFSCFTSLEFLSVLSILENPLSILSRYVFEQSTSPKPWGFLCTSPCLCCAVIFRIKFQTVQIIL